MNYRTVTIGAKRCWACRVGSSGREPTARETANALTEREPREDITPGTGGGHRTYRAPAVTRAPASRSVNANAAWHTTCPRPVTLNTGGAR